MKSSCYRPKALITVESLQRSWPPRIQKEKSSEIGGL